MHTTDDPSSDLRSTWPGTPRRRRPSTAVLVALITIAVLAIGGIAVIAGSGNSKPPPAPVSMLRTVTYEILGTTGSVDVTERTPGGTRQQSNVGVPMQSANGGPVTFRTARGAFVYLSAQNNWHSGTVTCRISVDGVVLSEVSSSGEYVIATCDGRVP